MQPADQELIALERQWMEAIQRKDILVLDQLMSPDYIYTASGHGRWTRQGWMDTLAVYDIHDFTFMAIDVRVYGDVAVVLPQVRLSASVAGEARIGEFLITDVWVQRDARWQVVARSSILMPLTETSA